jgi:hypothetical protein
MKILALEREIPSYASKDFRVHARAEALRLWELYQAGILREFYFRADRDEAVLVLECRDATEANDSLDSLPLVKAGLIAFDLIPLVPYPGFARLFEV